MMILYFLPKVDIKNYNVIIDGKHSFDQSIKNYKKRMITF